MEKESSFKENLSIFHFAKWFNHVIFCNNLGFFKIKLGIFHNKNNLVTVLKNIETVKFERYNQAANLNSQISVAKSKQLKKGLINST